MKVKELKELLNQFSDEDEMVFAYTDIEYSCQEYKLDCDIFTETLRVFGYDCVSNSDIYSYGKPLPYSEKEFVVLHV